MEETKRPRTASVRLAEELRDRAKVLAAKERVTIYAILNEAVRLHLLRCGA